MRRARTNSWIPDAWPLLLSREQVCAYLGISPDTFSKVCPVPPVDMGAQVVRYHRWQIEAWANALPPRSKPSQETTRAQIAAEDRLAIVIERIRSGSTPDNRLTSDLDAIEVIEGQRTEALLRVRAAIASGPIQLKAESIGSRGASPTQADPGKSKDRP
jgi:hypothetical protein